MDMTVLSAEGVSAHRLRLEAALSHEHRPGRPDPRQMIEEESYETLVEDQRESLRPAQHVERKLVSLLQTSAVLISHLQSDARPRPH